MAIVWKLSLARRPRLLRGVAGVALAALGLAYGATVFLAGGPHGVPTHIVLLSAGSTTGAQSLLGEPEPLASAPLMPALQALDSPIAPPAPSLDAQAQSCTMDLNLEAASDAMMGAVVLAPCRAGARVVLRHAGLAVTGRLDAAGRLEMVLPALEENARLEVSFGDGQKLQAALRIEDAGQMHRFGIAWQGEEVFAVHGFENGADFGQPGHVSPSHPGVAEGGSLVILGDASVAEPLLAQIYTYPEAAVPVEVLVEAAVTPQTCGHDLAGQVIAAQGGVVEVTDLTLAMPDCAAGDGFLVLKNLAAEMKLAAN